MAAVDDEAGGQRRSDPTILNQSTVYSWPQDGFTTGGMVAAPPCQRSRLRSCALRKFSMLPMFLPAMCRWRAIAASPHSKCANLHPGPTARPSRRRKKRRSASPRLRFGNRHSTQAIAPSCAVISRRAKSSSLRWWSDFMCRPRSSSKSWRCRPRRLEPKTNPT